MIKKSCFFPVILYTRSEKADFSNNPNDEGVMAAKKLLGIDDKRAYFFVDVLLIHDFKPSEIDKLSVREIYSVFKMQ